MKTLAITILMIISVLATMPAPQAQERGSRPERKMKECGTRIPPGQLKVELARIEQARKDRELHLETQALEPPTDAPYYLPLSIHIVRRSDMTGGLTLDRLNRGMEDLNRMWQPAGIQFFIYGNIDYINNDVHFNLPGGDSDADEAARDALRLTNPVANTINVYFTNLAGLNGESSFSTDPIQGVLMDIDVTGAVDDPLTPANESNPTTFAHEIGHYFDLYHTHEDWKDDKGNPTKVECPTRDPGKRNCSTTGDFLCDTDADPNLNNRTSDACVYDNSAMTPASCDSTPYTPPTRNLMSYSGRPCRDQFTGEQISKVLGVLRNQRPNLIIKGARYVDPLASPSNEDCSYNFPCQIVEKAIRVALNGDFIFIKPAYNHAANLGGKQVTLMRWGTAGEVNITR